MKGKTEQEVRAELTKEGLSGDRLEKLIPHKVTKINTKTTVLTTRRFSSETAQQIALWCKRSLLALWAPWLLSMSTKSLYKESSGASTGKTSTYYITNNLIFDTALINGVSNWESNSPSPSFPNWKERAPFLPTTLLPTDWSTTSRPEASIEGKRYVR